MKQIRVKTATNDQDFADARDMILAYVTWLGIDLSFQNFDQEMKTLPEMYSKQNGGLYVAYLNSEAVGVAGLRRLSDTEGEVKRMFVLPDGRGLGIGKLLLAQCIADAKALKYQSIKLDTADYMTSAIKLYADHGFVEIPAYRFNPHENAKYFELDLTK